MYGGTLKQAQRPDDDQFYCVVLYGDRAVGKMAPADRGTFDQMAAEAGRILADDAGATQVQVHNKGNFWHRVVRRPYCAICEATDTEPAFEHEHLMVTTGA